MSTLLVLVGVVTILPGGVALAFGRLPAGVSGRVAHPRLWGLGLLGYGVFAVSHIPSLHERVEDGGPVVAGVLNGVLVVGLIGMALSGGRLTRRGGHDVAAK